MLSPSDFQRRKLDLLPLKIISYLASILPAYKSESILLKNIIDQLDYSIPKEINSRFDILTSFGIKFNQYPSQFFHDARNSAFTFFVPAPLHNISTKYVLASDYVEYDSPFSNHQALTKSFLANIQLLNNSSKILPNISLSNLRNSQYGITLKSFSSLCFVDQIQFHNFLNDNQIYQSKKSWTTFLNAVSAPGFQLFRNLSDLSTKSINDLSNQIHSIFRIH
jgi:hypothetical protein